MSRLHDILARHVEAGLAPGAVALVAHGDRFEVETVGALDLIGASDISRDSIFRIASITKPLTAAAALVLVEDGRMALTDPIERWLPELGSPMVVRTPTSSVDDVVPATRAITVADLLDFRAGMGFGSDFSLPATQALLGMQAGHMPVVEQDAWLVALAGLPLLRQPGEAWLYNTCYDVLGVLISRVSGSTLADFLDERLFEPLGMADTAFEVPAAQLDRLTTAYRPGADGLETADLPTGQWSRPPVFASGASGLVSTVDDWYAFARFLLDGGTAGHRRLLSERSVRQMMTDQLTGPQRDAADLFLEGQGWGFGGSVDVVQRDPWNVLGRYGWIGGTGTSAHVSPRDGSVAILFTQRELTSPSAPPLMREFWTYATQHQH